MVPAPADSAPRDPGSERPAHSAWFLAALCLLVWASRMVLPGDLPYSDLDRSWCMSLGYALANFSGPLIAGVLIDHIGHARTFFALAMPLVPVIVVTAMDIMISVSVKPQFFG